MRCIEILCVCLLITISACKNSAPNGPPDNDDNRVPDFTSPQSVQILGYDGHAMEPFITRDGQYLFFNNLNDPSVNTNLHYAKRIDDTTFQYQGEIGGVNTEALEGTPTMDSAGHFYFISTRNYANDFSIAKKIDGKFVIDETATETLANINTEDLEYAASLSTDELELYFTRAVTSGTQPVLKVMMAARSNRSAPFGAPRVIAAITGQITEAPAITGDGNKLYFHKMVDGVFRIYLVSRITSSAGGLQKKLLLLH